MLDHARSHSGGGREPDDLAPLGETGPQQLVVLWGGEEVAAGAEVVADGAVWGQELLRVLGRLEALEHALSSAGGAVGVLCPVVEPLVAAMLHPRQHPMDGGRVAPTCP